MSALDILNEIKGDLPSPETQDDEITQLQVPVSPALEALQGKTDDIHKQMTLQTLIESVRSTERVPKELALEVFTMLPPMVSIQNHLTSAPSAYNKSFVLDRVTPFDRREEVRDFLNALSTEIYQVEEAAHRIKEITTTFMTLVQPECERLDKCPPMVVYPGGKFNLMTDHIERISEIHDALYNYPPYEGQLSDRYRRLAWNPMMKALKERLGHGDSDIGLNDILRDLRGICHYYENIDKTIAQLKDKLTSYSAQSSSRYTIEDAFNFIRNVQYDHFYFNGKDSIAEQVLDLVKFLK